MFIVKTIKQVNVVQEKTPNKYCLLFPSNQIFKAYFKVHQRPQLDKLQSLLTDWRNIFLTVTQYW